MTDRQYNSKLLGDKLSQLPVPPNEALWSRIEAQLLLIPPVVQHPPAKALPKPGKVVLVKTTSASVSAILLAVLIVRLVHNKAPQQQPAPAIQKEMQPVILDSIRADTATLPPAKPIQQKEPFVKPTPQPALADTEIITTPLFNRRMMDMPLRDSAPSRTPPAAAAFQADSVKLPTQKKDEGYYFEVKKKKG